MWPSISIPFGTQPAQVYTYSILIGLGLCHLLLGVDATARRTLRPKEESGRYLYCLGIACGGGWLFSIVTTQCLYAGEVPWGTASAMPGLVGGFLLLVVSAKLFRVPLRPYLELTVPFVCFMHAWGRLGCFMAGCCFGAPTETILGVQFPTKSPACLAHGEVPVHPTQLYELSLLIALGVVTQLWIPNRHRIKVYLIGYGLGRFCIEFLRGDDRGTLGIIPGASPSQHLSILFIIVGVGLTLSAWPRAKSN